MIGLSVKISKDQVTSTIGRIESPETRREVLDAIGQLLVARAKDTIAQRGAGGPDGPWPRTGLSELYAGPRIWGDIAKRIQYTVKDDTTISIECTHVAAGVRQLGTVGAGGELPDIVPVNKKALTIPVSEAASRASYQGIPARQAFPDAFIPKRPKGAKDGGKSVNIIVREIKGSKKNNIGARFEMLYVLVSKVAIRPHRFLPIDRAGNLAPAAIWQDILKLVDDVFLQPADAGGASASSAGGAA